MRDRFKRERNREKEALRSGAGASAVPQWRYMAIMGFIRPFIVDRETASNMLSRHNVT